MATMAVLCAAALAPAPAGAHPSDLGTLTLDLLLDRGGLVLIDGAAPRATEPERPSPAEGAGMVSILVGLALLTLPRRDPVPASLGNSPLAK